MATIQKMAYRHYKGGFYKVLYTGTHEKTMEKMIVYKNWSDGNIWLRTKKSFEEMVELEDGNTVQRFTKINDEIPESEGCNQSFSEFDKIRQDMAEVKVQLNELTDICSRILKSCDMTEQASNQMVHHISFVESIYSTVRTPLDFIRKKLAYITGETTDELPRLQ